MMGMALGRHVAGMFCLMVPGQSLHRGLGQLLTQHCPLRRRCRACRLCSFVFWAAPPSLTTNSTYAEFYEAVSTRADGTSVAGGSHRIRLAS